MPAIPRNLGMHMGAPGSGGSCPPLRSLARCGGRPGACGALGRLTRLPGPLEADAGQGRVVLEEELGATNHGVLVQLADNNRQADAV